MQVLDLDKFKPEERSIKIDSKVFDLTFIPFDISLEMYELIPVLQKLEETKKIEKEDYLKFLKIYAEIFKLSDETITFDWLRKRTNMERFNEMTPTIFAAIFATSKKNEAEDV